MKTAFSTVALAGTVLLHAALVVAVVAGLSHERYKPVEPWPIAVQLLPPPAQNTPPPVATAAPPVPHEPERKRPPPKRIAKPKPAPKPRATPTAQPQVADAPVERTPEPPDTSGVTAAPAEAPGPQSPPAPPVTIGVSIPASYAASNRKPEYPTLSRRYEEQGTVVLDVLVKADGTAGEVKLKSSSGYPLLDKSAISAVRGWRFNPATRDGKPIAQWYPLPITFTLRN